MHDEAKQKCIYSQPPTCLCAEPPRDGRHVENGRPCWPDARAWLCGNIRERLYAVRFLLTDAPSSVPCPMRQMTSITRLFAVFAGFRSTHDLRSGLQLAAPIYFHLPDLFAENPSQIVGGGRPPASYKQLCAQRHTARFDHPHKPERPAPAHVARSELSWRWLTTFRSSFLSQANALAIWEPTFFARRDKGRIQHQASAH